MHHIMPYIYITLQPLTHWGWVTHICVSKLTSTVSDNGLSPGRRQAIIWTNAGILLIRPLGTNFSEILIGIQTFWFKKMRLTGKWRPLCLGLNVLNKTMFERCHEIDWQPVSSFVTGGSVFPLWSHLMLLTNCKTILSGKQWGVKWNIVIMDQKGNGHPTWCIGHNIAPCRHPQIGNNIAWRVERSNKPWPTITRYCLQNNTGTHSWGQ